MPLQIDAPDKNPKLVDMTDSAVNKLKTKRQRILFNG
ncbi:hypothetical protein [Staphylococcus sp. S36]